MEFKDRVPVNPGRVKLIPVSGQANTYDLELADGAASPNLGTPLNKATFDSLKDDILTSISNNPNLLGPKGDKGDRGDHGSSLAKTFLVGTNSETDIGWFKLGSVTLPTWEDYHALIQVTNTYQWVWAPSGLLEVDLRRGNPDLDFHSVKWISFKGVHPEYIAYDLGTTGIITFYGYIPQTWAFYRIDVLNESNRNSYDDLFVLPNGIQTGGRNMTKYSNVSSPNWITVQNRPSPTGSIAVDFFTGTSTYNGKSYDSRVSAEYSHVTVGDKIFNFVKVYLDRSADLWFRIPIGNAKHISALPFRETTSGYTPGFICWSDNNYTYIGLDENNMQGAYIMIVQ